MGEKLEDRVLLMLLFWGKHKWIFWGAGRPLSRSKALVCGLCVWISAAMRLPLSPKWLAWCQSGRSLTFTCDWVVSLRTVQKPPFAPASLLPWCHQLRALEKISHMLCASGLTLQRKFVEYKEISVKEL